MRRHHGLGWALVALVTLRPVGALAQSSLDDELPPGVAEASEAQLERDAAARNDAEYDASLERRANRLELRPSVDLLTFGSVSLAYGRRVAQDFVVDAALGVAAEFHYQASARIEWLVVGNFRHHLALAAEVRGLLANDLDGYGVQAGPLVVGRVSLFNRVQLGAHVGFYATKDEGVGVAIAVSHGSRVDDTDGPTPTLGLTLGGTFG